MPRFAPSEFFKRISIVKKLLLLISTVIFIITVVVGAVTYFRESMILRQQVDRQCSILARNLANASTDAVRGRRLRELKNLVDGIKNETGVSYVAIVDTAGKAITHSNPRKVNTVLNDSISKKALASDNIIKQYYTDGRASLLDVSVPIVVDTGKIGTARLGFNIDELHLILRQSMVSAVFTTLFSVILGIYLTVFLTHSLSNDLEKLQIGADDIGHGMLHTRISIDTKDEFGELALALNRMCSALEATTVSKSYVDNIFKYMADCLIVLNSDGTIKTVNQAAVLLLGYQEIELLRQPAMLLIKDKKILEMICQIPIVSYETSLETRRGSRVDVSFSTSLMYDNFGNLESVVCVAHDITERLLAKQRLERDLEASREEKNKLFKVYKDVIYAASQGKINLIGREEMDYLAAEGMLEAECELMCGQHVGVGRNLAQKLVTDFGFSKDKAMQIKLCVSELATNVIKHTDGGVLKFRKLDSTLRVLVEDDGPGMEFNNLPNMIFLEGYSTKVSLGFGFSILFKYADKIFLYTSENGTSIALEFYHGNEFTKRAFLKANLAAGKRA